MSDDERLVLLADAEESESPPHVRAAISGARNVTLAVVLGLCVLWVAAAALLHRSVSAPMPKVTELESGLPLPSLSSGSAAAADAMDVSPVVQQLKDTTGASGNSARQRSARLVGRRDTPRNSYAATPVQTARLRTAVVEPQCQTSDSRLGLNSASVTELDALPGVGPVLAQRIVAWRTSHHGFSDVHELQEVPGIGPSKFARIRAHVTVR